MWPPCSPDLNVMDFAMCSTLEQKACAKSDAKIAIIKSSLESAWADILEQVVSSACQHAWNRITALIHAKCNFSEK